MQVAIVITRCLQRRQLLESARGQAGDLSSAPQLENKPSWGKNIQKNSENFRGAKLLLEGLCPGSPLVAGLPALVGM